MEAVPAIEHKKPHVVFIPFPSQSHMKCMLKLARLVHHKGLNVTFINTDSTHKRLVKSGGTCGLDEAPGFQFKTVPDGLSYQIQTSERVSEYLADNFLDSFLDLVGRLDTPVTCIVSDGVMAFAKMPYAAEKLRVPIILHWTFAACGFIGFYQAKVLKEKGLVPLKGDQKINCAQICKEWEVGMDMGRNVKRDEVEKRVRELMEGVEGARVRKKAMEWKKMAEISTASPLTPCIQVEGIVGMLHLPFVSYGLSQLI
ncbi:hypothetical protein L1987_30611 [Smallanthus sonchifolius]|uniref:Uncharacterized protein n=1 Tax=Smallanthus sonchifolius TaxID=185202 RepID=A0ACB9I2N6_9ASTR|nr:hypothetical protein L1987_30611 [Smallanthus sonchifolius]